MFTTFSVQFAKNMCDVALWIKRSLLLQWTQWAPLEPAKVVTLERWSTYEGYSRVLSDQGVANKLSDYIQG